MKVEKLEAGPQIAELVLVPEHPAEIALLNLFNECDARCELIAPQVPPRDPNAEAPAPAPPKLNISITVKKSGGRYQVTSTPMSER